MAELRDESKDSRNVLHVGKNKIFHVVLLLFIILRHKLFLVNHKPCVNINHIIIVIVVLYKPQIFYWLRFVFIDILI